jgi:hypothetical protein
MPGENIYAWSRTALDNTTADSAIDWREGEIATGVGGMLREQINNSKRSEMAAHAKFRNLQNGSIVTTGSANAQAFSSGYSFTGAPPTGMRVLLKIGDGLTNTGAMTLNMDGIGALAVKTQAGEDLKAEYVREFAYGDFLFNGTTWVLITESQLMAETIDQAKQVLLTTIEADGVANVDIIGTLEVLQQFDALEIVITDLVAGTANAQLQCRLSADGTTFLSGASDYRYCRERTDAVTPAITPTGNFADSKINLTEALMPAGDLDAAAGRMLIFRPADPDVSTNIQWSLQFRNHVASNFIRYRGGGCLKYARAITAVRFFMVGSTGGPPALPPTIHLGRFQVYGYKANFTLRAERRSYFMTGMDAAVG